MDAAKIKIFLVDDDIFHLHMMQQILEGMGMTDVHLFENGVECLNQIHLQPQIIFLDHNMDGYSGFEVLRKIKRFSPNIFVVIVSAQEEIKTAVESLKHGAFDYLQKDDKMEINIRKTLVKIEEVKEMLRHRKPSFFKSIKSLI